MGWGRTESLMILGGHGCLMGVNGVTTPSSEVASRFDLRKRAGEAKVRERGGGRGGGIGVPQSRPRAGAQGRNVPFGMDTLRGPAQYKQMCLLEISTSWAGSRAGTATGPGIWPHRSLCAAEGEGALFPPAIIVPRELRAAAQAAASPEEQAGQWSALEPLTAQGGACARVVVQTRLHGICPMPGLASSADSEAIRAPFVAHERHLHGVVVGAQAGANIAAVRSQQRVLGDGHVAPHEHPQARTSDRHNLKHVLPGAIKQFRVLGMQPRVHLSHPFGQEPPYYTAPPGCSEEGIRSGRGGASGLGGQGCVPRERGGKMLPEPTEEEEEESWGHEHHGGRAGRAGGYDALTL